jgi:PAS domain S-box-containing protein
MTGRYNLTLVALSVVTAILASYAALALAARVSASHGRFRSAWLAGGSLAMGMGIWSMHFVGMLAFQLPVAMAYDVPTIALSAAVAIAASGLGLGAASQASPTPARLGAAGILMGGAIAGMHYIGMSGLHVPARVWHLPAGVVASVVIAVVAAMAALALASRFRADEGSLGRRAPLASAVVMGLAIAGMHYVAMASVRFGQPEGPMAIHHDLVLRTPGLAVGVSATSIALLACVLTLALADRRVRLRDARTEALQRSEERFRALVEASAQIVWTRSASGDFVDPQPSWEAFTGMSREAYRGRGWLDAAHPDDRAGLEAGWAAAVADPRPYSAEYRLRSAAGEWRVMAVRAVPVLAPGGRVREWVGTSTDVTSRRAEERARDFLAEAWRVLGSSLDMDATLRSVARLAVPTLADWCAVDLVDPGGQLRRLAVEHTDPSKVALAMALQERYPSEPDASRGTLAVVRSGRTEWMADIPEELILQAARGPEHLQLLRSLGLRSYVAAPMAARGRVLGVLTLVHAEGERRFDARDVDVIEELAARAAVAVDNAMLYQDAQESREQLEQQASELEEAQAEMEMAHDELQRANEDVLQRATEAERARAEAEQANRAKSEFLATMSHELRTPLNAISGYAELLLMGIHGPLTDAQKDALERVRRNQLHLLGLINDVLNFARLEAGQVAYEIGAVPVDASLATLEALIGPQLREQGLQYGYRPGDPAVALWADRERVEQIVLNLLTNAIKFTPDGGRVGLEWDATDDVVSIRVSDTGIGIPADKLESIFEPFVQVDPALTRSTEGTGLGLSISRDLARAMGGDITVRSTEGRGSVFTLTLPRARAEGRDAA